MIKQYSYTIKRLILLCDVLILLLSYFLAYFFRFGAKGFVHNNHYWILLPSCVIIPTCFSIYGLYDFRYKTIWNALNKILLSHIIQMMVITFLVYLLRIEHFSRIFLASYISFSISMHSFFRVIIKKALYYLRSRGYNSRKALIVGHTAAASRIISNIEKNVYWRLQIVGMIKDGKEEDSDYSDIFKEYPIKGTINELKKILLAEPVDNVIFCSRRNITDLKGLILDIENMGISSHIAIPNPTVKISNTFLNNIDGIPLITYCFTLSSYPFNSAARLQSSFMYRAASFSPSGTNFQPRRSSSVASPSFSIFSMAISAALFILSSI